MRGLKLSLFSAGSSAVWKVKREIQWFKKEMSNRHFLSSASSARSRRDLGLCSLGVLRIPTALKLDLKKLLLVTKTVSAPSDGFNSHKDYGVKSDDLDLLHWGGWLLYL